MNRKAICRRRGEFTSSVRIETVRISYDWNLTYSHILVDNLWSTLEKTFHKLATKHLTTMKSSLKIGLTCLIMDINKGCTTQRLPTTCKLVVQRLEKSLGRVLRHGIERATAKCSEFPAELLDAINKVVRADLTDVYEGALTIVSEKKSMYSLVPTCLHLY